MGYPGLPVPGMDGPVRCRAQCRGHWRAFDDPFDTAGRLRAPLGGQEIELQQIDFDAGGMSLLRTRIREKSRFTVFDIDPQTAELWGQALLRWAQRPAAGRE